ncbi:MAG: PAS domain-containing protein [Verrucomicrobia bacterium]|nr:MAG: PAS domain-containing protein [Verrucomicrobiota bacterium]
MDLWPLWIALAAAAGGAAGAWWSRARTRRETRALRRQIANLEARLEETARHADERWRRQLAFFDHMADGVLVLDSRNRVQLANAPFRRWFRFGDEAVGRPWETLAPPPALTGLIARARQSGRSAEIEFEEPGVERRLLHLVARPFQAGTAPDASAGVVVVAHDRTRLRDLENARRDFVANVSHELRTPLSLIRGYVETLLEGPLDETTTRRFLRTIHKHTQRLAFLIEDLLTISRLESGAQRLQTRRLQARTVAQQALDDLRQPAAERRISLHNDIPPELELEADPDRLLQVFLNLVDNAIKYGRPGGSVMVGGAAGGDEQIELWVRDDGPGIPPEARERIFERFYRVDKARSREQGGTGLGLAIVKHIVQSHGGRVWVESQLGAGATFHIALPVRQPAPRTAVGQATATDHSRPAAG